MSTPIETKLVCPTCGYGGNNPAASACARCDARLPTVCTRCGASHPPNHRLCDRCATPLDNTETLQSLHRPITVLCVEVDLAPQGADVSASRLPMLRQACQRYLSRVVRRHEGIEEALTDCRFIAVFGLPTALEQHALRAVITAQALVEQVASFNVRTMKSDGVAFQIRVGLASGQAVSRLSGDPALPVAHLVGEILEVASTLQHRAAPGTILLDPHAAQLVRPLCHLTRLMLNGTMPTVEAYRLEGSRERGSRSGVLDARAPLVGRRKDIARLHRALRPLRNGRGVAIWLSGEAGIGKSRVTEEVLDRVRAWPVSVLEGVCFSHTQSVPYNAFIGVVRDVCQLLPTDDREAVQAKISRVVAESSVRHDVDVVPYLEYLLSAELVDEEPRARMRHLEPAQLKQQVFRAVRELILAATREQPVILVLDDLQWADELSTELIRFLAQSLERLPLALYLIARSDVRPHQRLMFAEVLELVEDHSLHLTLSPLNQADLRQMAQSLLPNAPPASIEWVARQAGGLPYYLEELARHTIERPNETPTVPASLEALIRSRYDRLPDDLQVTLAKAAVIGTRFSEPLLTALQGATTRDDLRRLQERAFVRPRRTSPDEWTFDHALIQEIIYHSLLERDRRFLHEQVGEALERLAGDRVDEQVALLAHHFGRSLDHGKALRYTIRAAHRAAGRFANDEALRLYTEAQGLLAQHPASLDERIQVAAGRADVLTLTGEYEAARTNYQRALDLLSAQPSPDPILHASLERRIAETLTKQNRYPEALHHLDRARGTIQQHSPAEKARINSDAAWTLFLGNRTEAEQLFRQSLVDAEQAQDLALQARIYNRLAGVYYWRGDLASTRALLEDSLKLSRQLEDHTAVASVLGNLGIIALDQADWEAAEVYHLQSTRIYARAGDAEGQVRSMGNAAFVLTMRGQFDAAYDLSEKAYGLARQINNRLLMGYARLNQGRAAFYGRSTPSARSLLVQARCVLRTLPDQTHSARSSVAELLSRLALRDGRHHFALRLARRAIFLADQAGSPKDLFTAKRTLALAHLYVGHLSEAATHLAELQATDVENVFESSLLLEVQAQYEHQRGQTEAGNALQAKAAARFARYGIPEPLRQLP